MCEPGMPLEPALAGGRTEYSTWAGHAGSGQLFVLCVQPGFLKLTYDLPLPNQYRPFLQPTVFTSFIHGMLVLRDSLLPRPTSFDSQISVRTYNSDNVWQQSNFFGGRKSHPL